VEKNWEDDIIDLEKKLKAAHDKLSSRQLNSHTDILVRFVSPPENPLDNTDD
jgi:hypothetical protein